MDTTPDVPGDHERWERNGGPPSEENSTAHVLRDASGAFHSSEKADLRGLEGRRRKSLIPSSRGGLSDENGRPTGARGQLEGSCTMKPKYLYLSVLPAPFLSSFPRSFAQDASYQRLLCADGEPES